MRLIIDDKFARSCRKIFLFLISIYSTCLLTAPLSTSKNFLSGMEDILQSIFFLKHYNLEDMTYSYALGILIGEAALIILFILVLLEIIYRFKCMLAPRRSANKNCNTTFKGDFHESKTDS